MSFEQFSRDNTAEDAERFVSAPEQEPHAASQSEQNGDAPAAERPTDRIGREETDKLKPEVQRMVTRGLGDLFELLPKGKKAEADDIISLIEHTELRAMLPGMRKKFAEEAVREKINRIEDKAEFIGKSLETEAIKLFIGHEAFVGASDTILARLREEREAEQAQPTPEDVERDARLSQLREEILGSEK